MVSSAASPAPAPRPRHVAIIMDGNGRWAQQRSRPRTFGHREGVEALRRAVEAAGDLGLEYLTVYGFSTENWTRPADEVSALFDLLRLYVGRDLDRLAREGVRIRIVGERDRLSPDIVDIIERAERLTSHNSRINLTIAFNYGGRGEILRVMKAIAADVAAGALAVEDISAEQIHQRLDTHDLPDPDLLIRTSGELRLSNFLLWQAAYAELVFLDVLWPDFNRASLEAALEEFGRRQRRFGGTPCDPAA